MLVLIAKIILVISLGGMVFIAVHKIPVLAKLSERKAKKPAPRRKIVAAKIKTGALSFKGKLYGLKQVSSEEKNEKKNEVDLNGDYWEKVRGE